MTPNKTIIVAYDISKKKTRTRVLKVVKSWKLGGQKSVHECRLTLRQAEELFLQLSEAYRKTFRKLYKYYQYYYLLHRIL